MFDALSIAIRSHWCFHLYHKLCLGSLMHNHHHVELSLGYPQHWNVDARTHKSESSLLVSLSNTGGIVNRDLLEPRLIGVVSAG